MGKGVMITSNLKIEELLKSIASKVSKKVPSEFVDILYREVSPADLAEISQDQLSAAAESMFKLFQTRKPKEFKVNLFQSKVSDDYVVLEVINKDVPFILDSIGNELKDNQYDIHLIVHPTFRVVRDKAGNFVSFAENGEKEAIIQIHLGNWFDEKKLNEIKARIERILECVNYSVSDWRTMTAKMASAIGELTESPAMKNNDMRDESVAFLEWLVDNHIVFLALYETELKGNKLVPIKSSELGLIRSELYKAEEMDIDDNMLSTEPLLVRKWEERSVVHRLSHLDLIVVKKFDAKGKCIGSYNFLGLFTSTVYYQSVRLIPLMRKKVGQVIKRYGYPESSHNCKELITTMESFPRGELLRMSLDELYETATGIVSLVLVPRIKVFIRRDSVGKFMSVITFIPEKRFNTETRTLIESIICKHLGGTVSKRYIFVGETLLTRLQLIVKVDDIQKVVSIERLEKDIVRALSVWSDELSQALIKNLGKRNAIVSFNKYKDAFDIKYRSVFTGKQAVHDLQFIEEAISKSRVCFDIYISQKTGGRDYTQLKIYSPDKELPLSSTMPAMENFGFYGVDEITYPITIPNGSTGNKKLFIHHFRLLPKTTNLNVTPELHDNLIQAANQIWEGNLENDRFNSLIAYVNATWREAALVRAYFSYLKLTDYPYTPDYSLGVLLNNTAITKKIIELFNLKFDIARKSKKDDVENLCTEIEKLLNDLKGIEEDKVCRAFYEVVKASKRTNFFQKETKNYISFKISSKELSVLPQPKPYAEIYVYSPRVEAVHLRGGKVARGGLRWSDRKEDFRTEVLGLMKAQMTKNSVIVPVGSKGGFIVKQVLPTDGREEYLKEGIECYKIFLSGILDITDNIVSSKIVPPKDVIRLDEDDPYLVVAADKGTATFSDYANSVSEKYGFWLGDAFASGGSAGYDHKKMGITAKGGWISVVRHFNDMGVDIDKEAFTCVGIGDMAGDVFGNGLILSDNIKLIAAFNHMHIFIDPNPDTKKSFAERKRLFELPRSAWTDYDAKLISKGGGIYERKQKSITLSDEARAALDIKEAALGPDELIKEILKAPIDLLWNGGIGTYVKAKTESNDKIGDKANDALRVNGEELRCKIIGEGGNLGMTQLGRIEYAKKGGRLNTDFIDNSAGVDCSDHEVNLKIATSDELLSKKLSKVDRDKFLDKMTDDVSRLVLSDNIKQTQLITIESMGKNSKINAHAWLIKYLESKGELDRKIEYLPDQADLIALISDKQSLTRPEIAVLVAYAKNSMYSSLNKHKFASGVSYNEYLYSYFPTAFQEKFPKLIESHKLKNEILATVLTNDLVNTIGSTFFHQFKEETGAETYKIVNAYIVVKKVFGIGELWSQIEKLTGKVALKLQLELFYRVQTLIERNIAWLVAHHDKELDNVDSLIEVYQKPFVQLRSKVLSLATPQMLEDYEQNLAKFKDHPDLLTSIKSVYQTKLCRVAFDIISLTRETNTKLEDTAKLYYDIGDKTYISWLLYQARNFYGKQYYSTVAIRALISELYEIQMQMVKKEITVSKKSKQEKYRVISNDNFVKFEYFINDLKTSGELAESMVAMLTIAVKRVRELA